MFHSLEGMSQNSSSQHLPTRSTLHTHSIYATEHHHPAAVGASGNPSWGHWEEQQLCPQLGTRTRLSLPGRRAA